MIFYSNANKTLFHKQRFCSSLILKVKGFGTRKIMAYCKVSGVKISKKVRKENWRTLHHDVVEISTEVWKFLMNYTSSSRLYFDRSPPSSSSSSSSSSSTAGGAFVTFCKWNQCMFLKNCKPILIYNGNRTEWSPIWSVIIGVIIV